MIEYTLDKNNNITGIVDYRVVNEKGDYDNKGEYVFINNWHINPSYRSIHSIAIFAKKVMDNIPWAKYGYFLRGKYKDKKIMYSREKWNRIVSKFKKEE